MRRLVACAVTLVALAITLLAGADGSDRPEPVARATASPTASPTPTATPAAASVPVDGPGLAVGITEPNPAFLWSPLSRPQIAPPFGQWRDAMSALSPAFYRLVIDWGALQPSPDQPPNLDQPQGGCLRATPPCMGWAGVREQLAALASRQAAGGFQTLVVITRTPDWAAQPASPCERAGSEPRSRAPRPEFDGAYERLVLAVLAAARDAGAELRYWSPWNEANHPYFLAEQHAPCGDRGSTPAAAVYARLSAALDRALAAAPGEQERVFGELAGFLRGGEHITSVEQFVGALPDETVCGARIVGQHAYIGGPDPVDTLWRAIAAHHCPRMPAVWITETGAGFPPKDLSAGRAQRSRLSACRAQQRRLVRWAEDPRVSVAFQYTLREDDRFQTGLVSTDVTHAYPTLALWQAWGGTRAPADPPPPDPCTSATATAAAAVDESAVRIHPAP